MILFSKKCLSFNAVVLNSGFPITSKILKNWKERSSIEIRKIRYIILNRDSLSGSPDRSYK